MNFLRQAALGALIALSGSIPALAEDITGAGSTFVFPVLSKWATAYSASPSSVRRASATTLAYAEGELPVLDRLGNLLPFFGNIFPALPIYTCDR